VLAAVADPIRLSIIAQLATAKQDLNCGAIELPIKTSTATHHFTALRRAGVLHQYYVGTTRMNVLRRQDMEQAFPGFLPSVIAATTHKER
jgi:DNA-binding transcriptional ArsR family regulator